MEKMDIKEFREKGYLQEVNRRFFHPLGLALEVIVDDNNEEQLGGIWDYRNDKEGIYYDLKNSDDERIEIFLRNEEYIDNEIEKRKETRTEMFGSIIEKITNK